MFATSLRWRRQGKTHNGQESGRNVCQTMGLQRHHTYKPASAGLALPSPHSLSPTCIYLCCIPPPTLQARVSDHFRSCPIASGRSPAQHLCFPRSDKALGWDRRFPSPCVDEIPRSHLPGPRKGFFQGILRGCSPATARVRLCARCFPLLRPFCSSHRQLSERGETVDTPANSGDRLQAIQSFST
ncbi:hypothetical protein VTK26DRAFT_2100 [Humicola hyalothermophila]